MNDFMTLWKQSGPLGDLFGNFRTYGNGRVVTIGHIMGLCINLLLLETRLVSSIVLERYFRFEISLLSILCMLIARMEMKTSRVSGDSDIIT